MEANNNGIVPISKSAAISNTDAGVNTFAVPNPGNSNVTDVGVNTNANPNTNTNTDTDIDKVAESQLQSEVTESKVKVLESEVIGSESGLTTPITVTETESKLPIDTAGIITYNGDRIKIKQTTENEFERFEGNEIEIEGKELKNIVEEIKSIKLGGGSKKRSLKKNKKHHKNTKKHKRTKQRRHKGKNSTLRK